MTLPSLLLALSVLAHEAPATKAAEGLPCYYTPRATADIPEPEPDEFPDCALRREDGTLELKAAHREALDFDQRGLAWLYAGGQFYYLRPDGPLVPVVTWDNGPDEFAEGLARTVRDGKIAYLNEALEEVIPPRYDWGWPFENGRARVCSGCQLGPPDADGHRMVDGGQWGYIDHQGHEVVPVRFSRDELP